MSFRFDPRKSSGAFLVKPRGALGLEAVRDTVATVQEWAEAQGFADQDARVKASHTRPPPGWKGQVERGIKARLQAEARAPKAAPDTLYG